MLTKIRYLFIKVCVLMLSRLREILTGKDLHKYKNTNVKYLNFKNVFDFVASI